ncbi:molecular chaperone HtpG [Lentzea flava]|uniref:Molecular chaperone HtpG n=2 Tax=Lentzea flava TaxID=103732 RepID=A0ABQ2VCE5_9PSEU|nr:HSP90 family protein [Lentzea flava]MCP2204596.1 molecular chaperone HtpG [Lentzea flava]GGU79497.1 molecular chaperone HtpG [Lentzea flava]
MSHTFRVDLRGIIDLLSHHLYSSPRVYVRELLQNAVDAITARRELDPSCPAEVTITCGAELRITDTGVGLTETEVHELLSTLGRTSKRDDLGFAREGFLGQFGVGMLSCFLVASSVTVITRSARGGPGVRWEADSSGNYTVSVVDGDVAVGTTVVLTASRGNEHWLETDVVRPLVSDYGDLLPAVVTLDGSAVTRGLRPWDDEDADLSGYCEQIFGFTPFEAIPIEVEAAGLTGVAFVLPSGVHPGTRQTHRVYLKRMLVGDNVEGLLPDWAYFVRCVVDASSIRPTASRESLYQDEMLLAVREELGEQIRDWLIRLDAIEPRRAGELLAAHHLGIKSLARSDDEMLRLVERWLPFETTDGPIPLRQFRRKHGAILYIPDVDEFHQLAPVAAAQGLGLVNAGYAYDLELLNRLSALDGPSIARRVAPTELLAALADPEPDVETALRLRLSEGAAALDRHDCDAVIRDFDPVSLPALLISNAEQQRKLDTEQTAEEVVDPLWAELLGQLTADSGSARPEQLVLNCRNPLVQRLARLTDPALVELTLESLYVHAVLQARRAMRPKDTAALNRSFLELLDRAVGGK